MMEPDMSTGSSVTSDRPGEIQGSKYKCRIAECRHRINPDLRHVYCYKHAPCSSSVVYDPKSCEVCMPLFCMVESPAAGNKKDLARPIIRWVQTVQSYYKKVGKDFTLFNNDKETLMRYEGQTLDERIATAMKEGEGIIQPPRFPLMESFSVIQEQREFTKLVPKSTSHQGLNPQLSDLIPVPPCPPPLCPPLRDLNPPPVIPLFNLRDGAQNIQPILPMGSSIILKQTVKVIPKTNIHYEPDSSFESSPITPGQRLTEFETPKKHTPLSNLSDINSVKATFKVNKSGSRPVRVYTPSHINTSRSQLHNLTEPDMNLSYGMMPPVIEPLAPRYVPLTSHNIKHAINQSNPAGKRKLQEKFLQDAYNMGGGNREKEPRVVHSTPLMGPKEGVASGSAVVFPPFLPPRETSGTLPPKTRQQLSFGLDESLEEEGVVPLLDLTYQDKKAAVVPPLHKDGGWIRMPRGYEALFEDGTRKWVGINTGTQILDGDHFQFELDYMNKGFFYRAKGADKVGIPVPTERYLSHQHIRRHSQRYSKDSTKLVT